MKPFKSVILITVASIVFFTGVLCVTPNLEAFAGTPVYGPFTARVIDGDTLSDGVRTYRLVGVDACEMGQPIEFADQADTLDCGFYAKSFVERFIDDEQVVCHDQGTRSYDRIVARCFVAGSSTRRSIKNDIGAFALHSGWAVATDHAKSMCAFRYIYEELAAKATSRGAWNGRTMTPAEWRRSQD